MYFGQESINQLQTFDRDNGFHLNENRVVYQYGDICQSSFFS